MVPVGGHALMMMRKRTGLRRGVKRGGNAVPPPEPTEVAEQEEAAEEAAGAGALDFSNEGEGVELGLNVGVL